MEVTRDNWPAVRVVIANSGVKSVIEDELGRRHVTLKDGQGFVFGMDVARELQSAGEVLPFTIKKRVVVDEHGRRHEI